MIRRMQPAALPRYHSLDALRAAMMLLGLVLHSAASYATTPLGAAWPYQDARTGVAFDLLIFFIHLFRMPVFFVVAGFFAALLYCRDGAAGFARNRIKRVLLPFLMFWAVMVPLAGLGFIFAAWQVGSPMPWEYITETSVLRQPILGHLWFLYYLLLFYAAALVVMSLAGQVPATLRRRMDGVFRAVAKTSWGAIGMALVTTLTLIPMTAPGLDTAPALLPPIRVLAAYGVFFSFGWLLFGHADIITLWGASWKVPLAAGVAAGAAYLFVTVAQTGFDDATVWHLTAVTLAGLSIWLLIFGIGGLFVRHLSTPRPLARYFSDASYWMYLTHLPLAVWLPGAFAHLAAPAFVKFSLVLGLTTLLTTVSYHYMVRSTVLGELLNGRRYDRARHGRAPASAALPPSPKSLA
jgi:glucans biosynthesis protein C